MKPDVSITGMVVVVAVVVVVVVVRRKTRTNKLSLWNNQESQMGEQGNGEANEARWARNDGLAEQTRTVNLRTQGKERLVAPEFPSFPAVHHFNLWRAALVTKSSEHRPWCLQHKREAQFRGSSYETHAIKEWQGAMFSPTRWELLVLSLIHI